MRKVTHGIALTSLAALALVACGGSEAETPDAAAAAEQPSASIRAATIFVKVTRGLVIRNATIVNTRNGALSFGMSVVVDQGKIQQIVPTYLVQTSGTAQVIDAAGKFLVPGFLDMHTHSMPMAANPTPHWPLMIANGITGIRDMAGAPPLLAAAQQQNAARAAGTVVAPEVLQMPGPPIAGAQTAAEGQAAVQATAAMGGAFVKVVNASAAAQAAVMTEAAARNLKVAGHLSVGTSAVATANSGWFAIEHLGGGLGIQLDCATDQAAIRNALLTGQGARPPFPATYTVSPLLYSAADAPFYQRAADTYSASQCETVARTMVQKGVWQTPTLLRLRTMTQSDSAEFRNDANLKYVDPTLRALWQQLGQEFSTLQPASAATTFRAFNTQYVNMLKLLRRQGGASKVLAGTDVGGIWVIPGFSLHQEFRELANAGFTPLEVLQATTLNGARYLNRESTMGTVDAGKNADLVLLNANPLLQVANLSKIAGVVNAGKYHSQADLDAMKASVATAYANAPLRNVEAVLDHSHKH